jgi:phosphate transport system protein
MPGQSHFQRQMQQVKQDLLKMAGLVERSVYEASEALSRLDTELAAKVIAADRRIDLMQNEIEERCITLLATQQPVAVDLRFLSAVIKITGHVERIGDQAVNLCDRVKSLAKLGGSDLPPVLMLMCKIAREMSKECLDAFAHQNVTLAAAVWRRDDELDEFNRDFLEEMIQAMGCEERYLRRGVDLILCSRHLERIGDECTNIAEEVIYLVEGRIIRHSGDEVAVGPL